MDLSKKKWASIISVIASSLFSFLIVFQIPLFRYHSSFRSQFCHLIMDTQKPMPLKLIGKIHQIRVSFSVQQCRQGRYWVLDSRIKRLFELLAVCLCRVACRNKSCETPLEVVSSELIASELIPSSLVKTLLYPGAIAKSLFAGSKIPSFDQLLQFYSFEDMYRTDIHHLEVCFFHSLHPSGYTLQQCQCTIFCFRCLLAVFYVYLALYSTCSNPQE